MTTTETKLVLDILDDEWQYLRSINLNDKPSLIQYAAAIWTMLELLPSRDRFAGSED